MGPGVSSTYRSCSYRAYTILTTVRLWVAGLISFIEKESISDIKRSISVIEKCIKAKEGLNFKC